MSYPQNPYQQGPYQPYGQPPPYQPPPPRPPGPRPFHALPTLVWLLAAGFAIGVLIALR